MISEGSYIFRKLLESRYAKFGLNRSKSLRVNKEHADRHSISCVYRLYSLEYLPPSNLATGPIFWK